MNPLRLDPSRTVSIRRRAIADMRRKLLQFKRKLREFVVTNDSLNLSFNQNFLEERVQSFKIWLNEALTATIFSTTNGASWVFTYLKEAHDQGVQRTFDDLNLTPLDVTKWNFTSEVDALNDFSRSNIARKTIENIKLHLNAAAEVIMAATVTTMALKYVENKNNASLKLYFEFLKQIGLIEKKLIGLLKMEIVRAQAEGQIDVFEQTETRGLVLMVEWRTSGGENVCPECQANAGHIYTIDESRGLIPLHINCQCSWGSVGS